MTLYSIVINWNDRDPEQGTYGGTVRAASAQEAERMVRDEMRASLADERGCDVAEITEESGSCIECTEGAAWEAVNMERVLSGLLEWSTQQGGHDATCWADAREVMDRIRAIGQPVTADVYECDNCAWTGAKGDLGEIMHYGLRVDEGGPEPDGECPECGCLAYKKES